MFRRAGLVVALVGMVWIAGAAQAQAPTRDPARAPAGTYELDAAPSSLTIRIPIMGGVSRYRMYFDRLSGGFDFDPANWQQTQVDISVDPRSLKANNSMFGRAVLGYFEPDRYPVILFRSKALVADASGRGRLTGDLTLHGVTRPISLDVQFNGFGADVQGAGARMQFSGAGVVRRSEFGLLAGRLFADDRIDLIFDVEFVRKEKP